MKPALVAEARKLIAKLPRGGKKQLAQRVGLSSGNISSLARGIEPHGNFIQREERTVKIVMELRKMMLEMGLAETGDAVSH